MASIILENEFIRASFNTVGGFIDSIVSKKDAREHAWHYDKELWGRRTAVCFPLCGKCLDDEYSFDGTVYSLPNHGFLREKELNVVFESQERLILENTYDEETLKRYPFKYNVQIEYVLGEDDVRVYYHVKNLDERTMYYSIGSHYTYLLPGVQEECSIFFSKPQTAGLFDQKTGLVSGDFLSSSDSFSLKGVLDSSSLIFDLTTLDTDYVALGDRNGIYTKVKGEGFRYLIVWAPAGGHNPFVCVEFWDGMGHVDTSTEKLGEKFGINSLEKGGERTYLQTIML